MLSSLFDLALIGAPSSAGARRTGQERGPAALRSAGLPARLQAAGLAVLDLGDTPEAVYQPDPEHPRSENVLQVAEVARLVAGRVGRALDADRVPLVLGGDCTITLGVIAALLDRQPGAGLVYFDGDIDLNTPGTTPSGACDGMVLAHVLGRGHPELTGIGGKAPLMASERIALFGYDASTGWIDPPELELLSRLDFLDYPMERIKGDPVGAAREARAELEARCDGILVHFDIDVTNCPAVDVRHPDGLELERAFEALAEFVRAPSCRAVVVTELNPERDSDGSETERVTAGLVRALGSSNARDSIR